MSANTLASLVVIASIVVVLFLIFKNMQAKRKILAGDSKTEKTARKWMRENGFTPDHSHFFRGTGIAFQEGNGKLVLVSDGKPGFHQMEEVASIRSHETTVTRMVGAAPGVVKPVGTTVYNMDVTLRNDSSSVYTVAFIDEEQRTIWETRLRNIPA